MLAAVTSSPSFDCRKTTTSVDRTICASPELAALDARLAIAFSGLQAKAEYNSGNAELMEQRLWLRRRTERCPDGVALPACLIKLYQMRLGELEAAPKAMADGLDGPFDPNAPRSDPS
ncbi:lysozyme inhibitor LprI family protein, partial [Caulobacter sp. S45]|uniref:lysozyme inhibitor LprI family protein n=1 Tax=Caulobacter sp. S45 TaxID=1641861 RepID=UPI00352B6AE3